MTATLSVQTFGIGQGRVVRAGRPLLTTCGQVHHLFFYLLAAPEGRSRHQLLHDLWDSDDTPAALNRLRVTVHRLKAAFGGLSVVQEIGGHFRLAPEVAAKADVSTFAMHAAAARTAGSVAGRQAALEAAVAHYHGDFLPELSCSWTDQAREQYRQQYVQVLLDLAALHCDGMECSHATHRLAEALKADPFLDESLHRSLISCLAHSGDTSRAVTHYRTLVRFLRDELGDVPMVQTSEVAERVRTSRPVCPHHIGTSAPCPRLARQMPVPPAQDLQTVPALLELLSFSEALLSAATPADAARLAAPLLSARLHASSVVIGTAGPQGQGRTVWHASGGHPSPVADLPLEAAPDYRHPSLETGETGPVGHASACETVPLPGGLLFIRLDRAATAGPWLDVERFFLARATALTGRAVQRLLN
ncbi:AfsR/SARP family transcriptional regulator [Deinococcus sonorensis]|uniref:BTAD domain-containing putative transcriptional regulator n=2 Tax=Deinococcus sonorensis TaxID=309891 RepID=A0AAU7UEC0_9DEIO